MKRWALRISLCLVLGVVTTVAVAWGLAWANSGVPIQRWESMADPDVFWERQAPPEWSDRLISLAWVSRSFGVTVRHVQAHLLPPRRIPHYGDGIQGGTLAFGRGSKPLQMIEVPRIAQLKESSFGLPFRSMQVILANGDLSGGEVTTLGGTAWTVPLHVAVPGFLFDTFVFAGTWVLALFGPGIWKRWIRIRRGLCPMCKYILRGNPEGVTGCAECGWSRG